MIQRLSDLYDTYYAEYRGEGYPPLVAHVEALGDALKQAQHLDAAFRASLATTLRNVTYERRQVAGDWQA